MITASLKKYFWDTDFNALDAKKHKKYILERILDMGDDHSVEWMRRTFSKKDILGVLKNNRRISKKSLNFWNLILNA